MKKLKYIFVLTFITILTGCSESERPIDEVFDGTTSGGILRTVAINNPTFDFNDPSVEWWITVEAQDEQDGELLSEVEVYVSQFRDASRVGSEVLVKKLPASEFTTGENGLPVGDISLSLNEVLNALNLSEGEYESTDEFRVRLEYVMTDGRTFTNTDAAGTVLTSSYFKSPYVYPVQFFCSLDDASIFEGNYTVTEDAWADYAVGDVIPVEYNPEDGPYTFRILSTNNPYIANTNSAYMLVTVNPEDGTATVASNESFDYGVPIDVTGSGSVGTCTGSINLSLNFPGYATNQAFNLVKN